MKKLLALVLALTLAFSIVACSAPSTPATPDAGDSSSAQQPNKQLSDYLAKHEAELLKTMEDSFATSSGMTCTSSVEIVGNNLEVTIKINELDNITEEQKQALQAEYDKNQSTFDDATAQMRTELTELENFKVYVCEKDGDILATIVGK